jgi:hypothetical protein
MEGSMFKQIMFCAVLFNSLALNSSFAQMMEVPMVQRSDSKLDQAVIPPDVADILALSGHSGRPDAVIPREELLGGIVRWLSENYDLPATVDHPHTELVPATQIANIRLRALAASGRRDDHEVGSAIQNANLREVVAFYDNTTKTIVLADDWTGATPADLSILIHEMVHHLQNVGQLKYVCPEAREHLAYEAQERWLGQFGTDLEKVFEIDGLTLLVRTTCMF